MNQYQSKEIGKKSKKIHASKTKKSEKWLKLGFYIFLAYFISLTFWGLSNLILIALGNDILFLWPFLTVVPMLLGFLFAFLSNINN